MEKQTGFPESIPPAWRVIGLLGLLGGALLLCALVLLAFGIDVGPILR